MPKAGMKTVTAKSRYARSSGSPWGCSPPSSLPLCGSVMTPRQRVQDIPDDSLESAFYVQRVSDLHHST